MRLWMWQLWCDPELAATGSKDSHQLDKDSTAAKIRLNSYNSSHTHTQASKQPTLDGGLSASQCHPAPTQWRLKEPSETAPERSPYQANVTESALQHQTSPELMCRQLITMLCLFWLLTKFSHIFADLSMCNFNFCFFCISALKQQPLQVHYTLTTRGNFPAKKLTQNGARPTPCKKIINK